MCHCPDEEQAIDATEKPGKTDGAMGPPLPVLTERPVRLEDGGLVLHIFNRLPRFVESIQACDEFLPLPILSQFDSPQLPFPQCILPGQTTKDDCHLKTEENTEDAQKKNQHRK